MTSTNLNPTILGGNVFQHYVKMYIVFSCWNSLMSVEKGRNKRKTEKGKGLVVKLLSKSQLQNYFYFFTLKKTLHDTSFFISVMDKP
jgi:hypothetical protein